MSIHFHKEIKKTEKRIVTMCTLVEESVRKSVHAFMERDVDKASEVINGDDAIDSLELDIEEECLKILALYQPVATDLRFTVAVLKINSMLERVGDYSVGIARRAKRIINLMEKYGSTDPFSFEKSITLTLKLLKEGIDALGRHDVSLAYSIIEMESDIEKMKEEFLRDYLSAISSNPEKAELYTEYLFVSRYLERIAEQAINIAEDVIYMVDGQILKHK